MLSGAAVGPGVAGTLRAGQSAKTPSRHDTTNLAQLQCAMGREPRRARGDVSDAELDYLDAMGSPDGRGTILPSMGCAANNCTISQQSHYFRSSVSR
jgi:hypothetical protein